MNCHPVRQVGHLPDFHTDACNTILLDFDMGDTPANPPHQVDPFPNDFFEQQHPTSPLTTQPLSPQHLPINNSPYLNDDILDNIIARCFDGQPHGFDSDPDCLSANDSVLEIPPHHQKLLELDLDEETQSILANFDTSALHHENHHLDLVQDLVLSTTAFPSDVQSGATHDQPIRCQPLDRRKRAIKKGKRSRAPARPWTEEEHLRFEESLELFGRNWEQCAAYIGTRRAQLVRSHAQKHLIKLWKLGKPLPKKVAESGNGYTLSGKPLLADSASARSYLTKIPCPAVSESHSS